MALAVVVGNVIGSGIFLKPGAIATEAGSFGFIITLWVAGGILCILGALCFAELATMLPKAGGLYVYLREAYGRLPAFLFGWSEFLFNRPASIAALAVAFIGSLSLAIGIHPSPLIQVVMAATLIVGTAMINIFGVLWGGRLQMLTTLIKGSFLALVGVLPFVLTLFDNGVDFSNYASTVTPREASVASQMGAVLLAVMWAYNGWHGITPLAEEVSEPQRNIPRSLFGGVGILIVLYVTANCAYHGVLSMDEMSRAGDHAAEHMLDKLFGPAGRAAMSAVIMCSVFGGINSNLLQAPRVIFAMGRDGVFFTQLGRVHNAYHTPAVAILVNATMAIALIALVTACQQLVAELDANTLQWEVARVTVTNLQNDSIFGLLTNFVIFSASVFYSLGVLAVIVLRRRHPEWERPYKTWGYPIVPLAFLIVYLWFLSAVYVSNPLESRVGLVLIGLGVPAFYAYRWWARLDNENRSASAK